MKCDRRTRCSRTGYGFTHSPRASIPSPLSLCLVVVLRGGWRADDNRLGGGRVTDGMLGIGMQRGAAVQRDKMSIDYESDIWGGVGVDQGRFGTVLPKVLLRWMPSRLSSLAVVVAGAVVSRRDGQQLAMVESPGQVDDAAHVGGANWSPACRWRAIW